MRTTLTLDEDVAALIRKTMKSKKTTLKEVVNQALRRGLIESLKQTEPKPYQTPSVALGKCLIGQIDDVAEILEITEEGEFKK